MTGSDELAEMRARMRMLEQRIAELEREQAAEQPASTELTAPTAGPASDSVRTSRRGLLRLAGAGVAGAAAAVVARPGVAAAVGTPLYIGEQNSASWETQLYVTSQAQLGFEAARGDATSSAALALKMKAVRAVSRVPSGFGVDAYASGVDGTGVNGYASNESGVGVGVRGETLTMYGVHGVRRPTAGPSNGTAAVYGEHQNVSEFGTGVIGSHDGSGWGMWAKSKSGLGIHADGGTGTGAECVTSGFRGKQYGIVGRVTSTQPVATCAAVRGATASTTGNSYGVHGSHAGTGTAVYGECAKGVGVRGFGGTGRGGVFTGGAAQVNLTAGALATHPVTGVRGDLYVDSSGALWFCKTGGNPATWAQIA